MALKPRRITRAIQEVPFAGDIYAALQTQEYQRAMFSQVEIDEPPAGGISPLLMRDFPKVQWDTNLRQVIGMMIRQVMDTLGYEVKQKSVHISQDPIFMTGTAYRIKPEGLDDTSKYYVTRFVQGLNKEEKEYLKSLL